MKRTTLIHQGGFSIIAVIFVLVVLAGLGAVMVQLSVTQHLGTAMAYEGRQAYYAARAGLEWQRHQAVNGASCSASTFTTEGFTVSTGCSTGVAATEGDQHYIAYHLTSTATLNNGVLGATSRELNMSVWRKISGP